MSEFTYVKETDTKGMLRYKGRKCGTYTIHGKNVEVDISTTTGKAAWKKEFNEDSNAISKFFGLDMEAESAVEPDVDIAPEAIVEPILEPDTEQSPEPMLETDTETEDDGMVEWRKALLEKAEANGNIAAIKNDGNGAIYEGPATQENIDAVLEYDDVVEVLNDPAKD